MKWQKTKFIGVRFREHPTRKHGIGPDKYFAIRYRVDGKRREEGLGWATEGWNAQRASMELAKLKEAIVTGTGLRTLEEKRQAASEARAADEAERQRLEREAVTFAAFWDAHYWPLQEYKAEGSRVAEEALFKTWIKPVIGNKPLAEIAPFDIERIKTAMLKAGRAPASIKYAFAVISQAWNFARRDGFLEGESPTKLVNLPKRDNRRERFLEPEEARALLDELKFRSPTSHDMAVFALFAGLRFGEIAGLTWRDVDMDRGTLSIRDPKGKVNRQAFISSQMREVLDSRALDGTTGLIFRDGKGKRLPRVSVTFRRIADEMFNQGVTDSRQKVCFHSLRHSFASWLVANGTSLYAVKELMGHADFKMTQRYSHLAPDGLRAAANGVDGIMDNCGDDKAIIVQLRAKGDTYED